MNRSMRTGAIVGTKGCGFLVALVAGLATSVVGCGDSGGTTQPAVPSPSTTAPSGSTTPAVLFTLDTTWRWTLEGKGRTTMDVALKASAPQKIQPGSVLQPPYEATYCRNFDFRTDGVVAYELTYTNTSSTAVTMPMRFYWQGGAVEADRVWDSDDYISPMSMLGNFSDGPDCDPLTVSFDPHASSQGVSGNLAVGQTQSVKGVIVVHDYFTARHPEGDPGVLGLAALELQLRELGGGAIYRVIDPQGPGIYQTKGLVIPLGETAKA